VGGPIAERADTVCNRHWPANGGSLRKIALRMAEQ